MIKLKFWIRQWLNILPQDVCDLARDITKGEIKGGIAISVDGLEAKLAEAIERIQDLEDAYPGYKQAKEDADKTPEPLIAGFMPFSQRKKQFERSRRKPEKK